MISGWPFSIGACYACGCLRFGQCLIAQNALRQRHWCELDFLICALVKARENYRILIVEDELIIAEVLMEMLESFGYSVVGIAKNYDRALAIIDAEANIDLAILDINLGGVKTGIDVGRQIKQHHQFSIAYLTSYGDLETISEAGTTQPEAYLIKPFKKEDIRATVEIIRARGNASDKTIILKDGYNQLKVPVASIHWIKVDGNYLEVYTADAKHLVRNSIEAFIAELSSPQFVRTHRSYAVNLDHIKAINGHDVFIGDEQLPLSRKYKDLVLTAFGQ